MRAFGLAVALMTTAMPVIAQAQDAPAPQTAPSGKRLPAGYKLDSGDKLRVTVYEEPGLTGNYEVTDSGDISFPLIGNVEAGGKSVREVQDTIAARLAKGYVKDPKVSIELAEYRPFYILGEVNKAGEYPFRVGLLVDQAVAAAGGYSYRANTKNVWLRRSGQEREQKINLRGVAVPVMPGDTIRVGERFF